MISVKKTTDSKSALKIAQEFHESYFNDQGLKDIQRETTQHVFYGAFDNKTMIGFITYKEINSKVVEITWMAIDSSYQNKGVGTKLLNESLDEIKDNYKACEVKTLANTDPDKNFGKTRGFYVKNGFLPLEVIQPYPGWDKNMPCQIFVKFLS